MPLASNTLVVHCAASGLGNRPPLPLWQPDRIRLQTIRAGFPFPCPAGSGCARLSRIGFLQNCRDQGCGRVEFGAEVDAGYLAAGGGLLEGVAGVEDRDAAVTDGVDAGGGLVSVGGQLGGDDHRRCRVITGGGQPGRGRSTSESRSSSGTTPYLSVWSRLTTRRRSPRRPPRKVVGPRAGGDRGE